MDLVVASWLSQSVISRRLIGASPFRVHRTLLRLYLQPAC